MSWQTLLVSLLLASPSVEVARVGATVITRADVEGRLAFMRGSGDRGGALDAVNGLVGERLLEAEARRLGLAGTPAVKARVEQERRRLAGELLEERDLRAAVRPAEAELRAMYHSTADSVRLEQLVFEQAAVAAAAAARAARSGDLSAEAGLAVVKPAVAESIRAQLDPRLAERAFAAPVGSVQGPIEADAGWVVVKILARHLGDEAGFQAQREALVLHATKGAVAQARAHLARQLRAQQQVALDEAFLAALPKGNEATAEQRAHVLSQVAGQPLTYGEILPTLKQLTAASGHASSGTVKIQVAWQEIEARLLQDAAVRRGYADDASVKARLPAIESVALVQALADQVSAAVEPPTEQEVAAAYRRLQGQLGQPLDQVRPALRAQLASQRRAEAILAKVRELRGRTPIEVRQAAVDAIQAGR